MIGKAKFLEMVSGMGSFDDFLVNAIYLKKVDFILVFDK